MAKRKVVRRKSVKPKLKKAIEQYEHDDKRRLNNPPVGLVTSATDPPDTPKKKYAYDPHLDPQLVWAGKAEGMSFEVPTVSFTFTSGSIQRRSLPPSARTGTRTGRREMSGTTSRGSEVGRRSGRPIRQSVIFRAAKIRHSAKRSISTGIRMAGPIGLMAGDSLLVMNSLLEKEGMAGKVQMVYIDPPYGIRYGSNFQPFINRRDVKDGKDEDLTQEPETIKAFRDTWELGIHSYLNSLRDRLLLARRIAARIGSVFVQISDAELVHHVRCLSMRFSAQHNS